MDISKLNAPPCIKAGLAWNKCAEKQFEEQILNHINLVAEWHGWKFKGKDLVSPDGHRINPQRLRGIMWAEKRLSVSGAKNSTASVVNLFLINKP